MFLFSQEVSIKPTAKLGSSTFDCKVQSAQTTPPVGSFMQGPLTTTAGHGVGAIVPATVQQQGSMTTSGKRSGHRRKQKCPSSNGAIADSAAEFDVDKSKVDRLVALACRIDRYSRGLFPLMFAAFNITYWVIFVNISPQPKETDFVFLD